jgi:translation initiation factor IF-2
MGHIDHGKSTLLDYIRTSNVVAKEIGGITQKMSAYEVVHKTKVEGKSVEKEITFVDTPGHESFNAIRARGASAADIAILVVSAEDGVKPQTLDALKAIKNAALPYIVGISKIDKPNANLERTKQTLAENEIYVEGYGGEIPVVPFSGITGAGVDDLLDMILLVADVENFTADTAIPAECIVVEANRDKVRGISATLIIKNGTIKTGDVLVSGNAISPVRILENFLGKGIKTAKPSQPVRVVGWSDLPEVGGMCFTFSNKKDAEKFIESEQQKAAAAKAAAKASGTGTNNIGEASEGEISVVPILLKADTSGSVEALKYELAKIKIDRVVLKVIASGIGDIGESDIKTAAGNQKTLIIGFNTKVDASTKQLAERMEIGVHTFDIIYKMTEWLTEVAKDRAPKVQVEEQKGIAKILKIFSVNKNKQVLGGRVESGTVSMHDEVKVMRRDTEIGRGHIRELQQMKEKVGTVEEGKEFGAMIESKIEIAPGDRVEAFHIVTK